jgi:hypothetical protein
VVLFDLVIEIIGVVIVIIAKKSTILVKIVVVADRIPALSSTPTMIMLNHRAGEQFIHIQLGLAGLSVRISIDLHDRKSHQQTQRKNKLG